MRIAQPLPAVFTLIAAIMLAVIVLAGSARAQSYSVIVSPSTPDLGTVASGAVGDTVFRIAPFGTVSRISGMGGRVLNTSTMTTVTVSCSESGQTQSQIAGGQNCAANVDVQVAAQGSPTRRGKALTNFTVGMGTATLVSGPSSGNPLNFTIAGVGKGLSKTFYVGMDFPIAGDDSGKPTGASAADFVVGVGLSGNGASAYYGGTAKALVFRAISVSKTSDLSFGRIVRPVSGSGSVAIAAATGQRTAIGAVGLATPAATRAAYAVTGEGGQTFSISIPATFAMTGPDVLTVTTTSTVSGGPMLSSALGSVGTYGFSVGGSFPITSNSKSGAYNGTFAVTVDYN